MTRLMDEWNRIAAGRSRDRDRGACTALTRHAALAMLTLCSVSCGAHMRPTIVLVAPPVDATVGAAHPFVTDLSAIHDPRLLESLSQRLHAVQDLVRSPAFRSHLASIARLDDGKDGSARTGADVLRQYVGLDPVGGRFDTHYADDEAQRCTERGATGTTTAVTGYDRSNTIATTHLRCPTVLRIEALDDPYATACATNTLAHEFAHTLHDGSARRQVLFVDPDHARSSEPLVSYTVGAVAQCTVLERDGRLAGLSFAECVNMVGTTVFDPGTCTAAGFTSRAADAISARHPRPFY